MKEERRRTKDLLLRFIFLLIITSLFLYANTLQDAINQAKPNSTIELGSGVYKGDIIINKPLKIIGKKGAKVIIKNSGKGTIITIKSSNVLLQNLTIKSSGHRKEVLDSGIKGEGINNITIKNCHIEDVLYGINLSTVKNLKILSNFISSIDETRPLRADGIKLWYTKNVLIKNNIIQKVRDTHIDRSSNIIIKNNKYIDNRFAIHFEYSKKIYIEDNFFQYDDVGILTEATKNLKILNNKLLSGKGSARIAMVLKGGDNIVVENNIMKYNSKGLYIDAKPTKLKKTKRYIIANEISYNLEGIHFHAIIANNVIKYNKIHDNLEDVVKDIIGYKNVNNIVEYNYWGAYQGFDKNRDNIGDTPYIIKRYMDKLWSYNNKIRFFYGSVVIALANFLCEIAPFSEPEFILEDKKPIFKPMSQE